VARESEKRLKYSRLPGVEAKVNSLNHKRSIDCSKGVRDFCDNEEKMIDGAFFKKRGPMDNGALPDRIY